VAAVAVLLIKGTVFMIVSLHAFTVYCGFPFEDKKTCDTTPLQWAE
jgi:hypothetical protein